MLTLFTEKNVMFFSKKKKKNEEAQLINSKKD